MKRIFLSIQVLLVLSSYFTAAIGQTEDPILYADEQAVFFEKPNEWGNSGYGVYTYIYYHNAPDGQGTEQNLVLITYPWKNHQSGNEMEHVEGNIYKFTFNHVESWKKDQISKWKVMFNNGYYPNYSDGKQAPVWPGGGGTYDGWEANDGGYYTGQGLDRIIKKTILPKNIVITNETVTYNGVGQSPTITITPGVSFSTKYKAQGASPSTYTTTKPTKVGTYDVLIDITESGYIGSNTGTFTIKKATINKVLFLPQSKTYDGTTSVANIAKNNFTIPGIYSGDIVSVDKYNTALYDNKNAGDNKTIEITGIEYVGAGVGNYNLPTSAINTSNKISPKPLTITADAGQTKVYDKNSNVPASYSYTHLGLVSGDSFSGALKRVPGENAGTYAIGIGDLAPSGPNNYSITFNPSNFEITKKALTITDAKAEDKIYDATDIASISGAILNGVVGTDVVSLSVSATFNNKNVGIGKTVSTTFSLTGGTEVNNYSLIQPTGFTANVTARKLEIIGFSIKDRKPTTDGDLSAEVESWGTLQPIPTPDIGKVNIKKEGVTASFPSNTAGEYEINLSTLELEGPEKDNYTLKQPEGDALKANITNDVPNFEWSSLETTYNGIGNPVTVKETNSGKDATIEYDHGDGDGWVTTFPIDAGIYLVKATSTDLTYVGNQTKILTINKKSIPAATFEAVTKVFDNTTNVSPQPTLILADIEPRDQLTVTASGDAAKYDTKNVGENKTVTINNIKLSGTGFANYTIPQTATNDKCSITQLDYLDIPLVFSFPAQSKVFDGTDDVVGIPSITISGFLSGDSFTATATSATYDSPRVGTGKKVTLSGITYSPDATKNYKLPKEISNDLGEITKLSLGDISGEATATIAAQTKVYDGTTDVKDEAGEVYIPTVSLSGLLPGFDDVIASRDGASAVYNDKNVGSNNKTVTVSGITYKGDDADNYTLPSTITNSTSSIKPMDVEAGTGLEVVFDAQTKDYDGTTEVKDAFGNIYIPTLRIKGLIGSDEVTVSAATAAYDDKNVGNNKTITIKNISYGGADVMNYKFPTEVVNSSNSITPLDINKVPGIEVTFGRQSKTYDGTIEVKDASGDTYVPSLTVYGLIGADEVTAIGKTATYDDKNVKENKVITIQGITYSGSGVNNYILPTTVENNKNSITPLDVANLVGLKIEFDAQSKVYDGTTEVKDASGNIYVPSLTVNGLIGADMVTAIGDTAYYDNKNAAVHKTVTIGNISYGGVDVDNYSLPTTVENNKNSITPLDVANLVELKIKFDAQSKVYDGTTEVKDASGNIYVPSLTVNGLIGADEVTAIGKTATYDNKNVGEDKVITIQGIDYSGDDAENYELPKEISQSTNAVIRKLIVITPLEDQEKIFNDEEMYLDFIVKPVYLDNSISIKNELIGELSWNGNRALGSHEILQGTLTNAYNPNYEISFVGKGSFEMVTDIQVIRKWGYMLLIDNKDDLIQSYQWYRDGVPIVGETHQYYADESETLCGIYSCEIKMVDGTKLMLPDYEFLENCGSLKSVSIYPNPVKSKGDFYLAKESSVEFNAESTEYMVEILNIHGQVIEKKRGSVLDKVRLNAPVSSGIYFLRIFLENKELEVIKILVTN